MKSQGINGTSELTLTSDQRRAVESRSPLILVNAGAGSGKTLVLSLRVTRLLKEGVSPWNILALTFTRYAAGEMRRRIEAEVGEQRKLTLSTFHAFAASLIERWGELLGYRKNFSIYDGADQVEVLREILTEQGMVLNPQQVARDMQNGILSDGDILSREYQRRLKERNALDYPGLIRTANRLLEEPPVRQACMERFHTLLVDEVQDTDPLQWKMIELLRPEQLFMAGDDYQSIYRFRGARIDHILSVPQRFPEAEVIRLEQNFRSTQAIVESAGQLIAHNSHQLKKKLRADLSPSNRGPQPGAVSLFLMETDSAEAEAETVARLIKKEVATGRSFGQIAVLYRTHLQAMPLARALQEKKIPCQVVSSSFWEKDEVREFMSILNVLHNPGDDIHVKRILPKEGYPEEVISTLNLEAARSGAPFFEILPDSSFKEHLLDLREKIARGTYPSMLDLAKEVDRRFDFSERYRKEGLPLKSASIQRLFQIVALWQEAFPEDHSLAAFLKWQVTRSVQDELRDGEDSVKLLTVHAAKGLEWPAIFLCGLEQGLFPMRPAMGSPAEMEEERRLMYVAMTRAKETLYLLWAKERNRFGRTFRNRRSQFLDEMNLMQKSAFLKSS